MRWGSRVVRALVSELRGAAVRYPCSAANFPKSIWLAGMGTWPHRVMRMVREAPLSVKADPKKRGILHLVGWFT